MSWPQYQNFWHRPKVFLLDLGFGSNFMSKAFFVLESNFTKIMFSKKHTSTYRNLQTDNSCHYIKNARISIMRENMGQRKLAFLHIFRSSVLKTHQKKWSIYIKFFYLQQSITIKGIDIDHKASALASLSMKNKFMTELPQKKKKNTSKRQQATYCNHNMPLLSINFSIWLQIYTSNIKTLKTSELRLKALISCDFCDQTGFWHYRFIFRNKMTLLRKWLRLSSAVKL